VVYYAVSVVPEKPCIVTANMLDTRGLVARMERIARLRA